MAEVKTFPFSKKSLSLIKEYHFGLNWPVVYIQEDGREMYVGQTTSLFGRSRQHIENPARARLKRIHVLTDEEFNMSAAYDFESLLIQYVSADGKFKLQNANGGLVNHNYFEREKYQGKFESIWKDLQSKGLVAGELKSIRNSEYFKFSPYKALTEDQLLVAKSIERQIKKNEIGTYIVHGAAGTGKSILALYLLKHLKENTETKHLSIALVVPMTGLRTTLQRVVRKVPGLGVTSVIGPSDVTKKKYDLLIVDEAHRLRRRVNLSNFGSYDKTNKSLGLPKDATQLDWILACSKQQILFYDARQNVVPADIRKERYNTLNAKHYELTSQMRVAGGEDYLGFIDDLFDLVPPRPFPTTYEFKIFSKIGELVKAIRSKNTEHSLARVVAGYAWAWKTKKNKEDFDIELDGMKFSWNSTNIDWINSKNSINEIGCIHTIQGYDLNYAGVIIGPEVSFDFETQKIVIDEKKYKDINGKRSISDPQELRQYILNIYKTLLTRGIKGTYLYIVDEALRSKFKELSS